MKALAAHRIFENKIIDQPYSLSSFPNLEIDLSKMYSAFSSLGQTCCKFNHNNDQ